VKRRSFCFTRRYVEVKRRSFCFTLQCLEVKRLSRSEFLFHAVVYTRPPRSPVLNQGRVSESHTGTPQSQWPFEVRDLVRYARTDHVGRIPFGHYGIKQNERAFSLDYLLYARCNYVKQQGDRERSRARSSRKIRLGLICVTRGSLMNIVYEF
jgi:hypothetical protein